MSVDFDKLDGAVSSCVQQVRRGTPVEGAEMHGFVPMEVFFFPTVQKIVDPRHYVVVEHDAGLLDHDKFYFAIDTTAAAGWTDLIKEAIELPYDEISSSLKKGSRIQFDILVSYLLSKGALNK